MEKRINTQENSYRIGLSNFTPECSDEEDDISSYDT